MSIDQIRTAVKSARKTCANQVGASKELLDNAAEKGEFPPDPKLQCYLKCIMTLSKAVITSSDPCEAAWQFSKCYYETDSSVNVI
ncbi:hypothetical protein M0802_016262 [Mischocyttarus mexicanus]|nr:hypothetical protein M0802_016262 [Mischocyttarus mexicanus]